MMGTRALLFLSGPKVLPQKRYQIKAHLLQEMRQVKTHTVQVWVMA